MVRCTRWDEIKHMALEHARWNAATGTPCEFVLLNPPSHPERREGVDFAVVDASRSSASAVREQVEGVRRMLDQTQPGGVTPTADRLSELHRRISHERMDLAARGQRVVLVVVTDGLPTKATSNRPTQEDKRVLVEALRKMTLQLPVFVVLRLVTDEDDVVEFYNNVDQEIELDLEVLDDIKSEAKEIASHGNAWLVYSPLLHHLREGGTFIKLFDLLDERSLAPYEISLMCQWLLREPEAAPFPAQPQQFVETLGRHVSTAPKVYDPRLNLVAPPIDVNRVKWVVLPFTQYVASVSRRLMPLDSSHSGLAARLVQRILEAIFALMIAIEIHLRRATAYRRRRAD
mmetsp:Transcript_119078/g.297102  ORF Transcript_119078/g.297102 Transcript_119078/m.297102 type:complete len:345 (-) Transcript_119078:80-1114(-)